MVKIEMHRRQGDFGFEAVDEQGHSLLTDSSAENGGSNAGFRPMQLLLAAMGGCSAIDMISILKKQKQPIEDFKIDISGEREAGALPSLWKEIHVTFRLWGNIDKDKAERAAALSMEKYCSVAETLRRAGAAIHWTTIINQQHEQPVE